MTCPNIHKNETQQKNNLSVRSAKNRDTIHESGIFDNYLLKADKFTKSVCYI